MDIEHDTLHYGGRLPECVSMSVDVKLAFSRISHLIDSLKDDFGSEAASFMIRKLRYDAEKLLKRKRDQALAKENGYHHANELNSTNASTARSKGFHLQPPVSQSNVSARPASHQPYNENVSFFSRKEQTDNGLSFSNNVEEHKQPSSYKHCLLPDDGHTSFHNNKNEKLYTSFSSSFRPVCNKNVEDPYKSVQLGTIIEENRFEVDYRTDSDDDGSEVLDEEKSNAGSTFFFLKAWSVIKRDNDLFLSGIKMNEKGEIIDKDFISKKVVSRKDKDTVKTSDGEFLLQGLLLDPKKLIPIEVKNYFSEETVFPRFWKKALKLWIDLDKKKLKEEKMRKRSISPKKKITVDKTKNSHVLGKRKLTSKKTETTMKTTPDAEKCLKVAQQKKGKSSAKKLKENEISDKVKNKNSNTEKMSPTNVPTRNKPQSSGTDNKKNKKTNEKNQAESDSKKTIGLFQTLPNNKKITKNNEEKLVLKKNKRTSYTECHDQDRGENYRTLGNDEVQDDHGPFSELLGDESLFVLPKSSLTPNQLLGSIKKNVIKGRCTPPTNMFDNVYGNKSDNNSSVNTSFDEIGVKNDPVVKRMSKVSNKINPRKNNNKTLRVVLEECKEVNEILQAANAKTNTTPSIIRQVFSAEKAEDSVNFSDLSDVEDD